MLYFTHMGRKNPWSDLHKILHWGRYAERNYRCKFGGRSLSRFCVARGQILGFSIGFRSRPYNTLALPCECVIVWEWSTASDLWTVFRSVAYLWYDVWVTTLWNAVVKSARYDMLRLSNFPTYLWRVSPYCDVIATVATRQSYVFVEGDRRVFCCLTIFARYRQTVN